MDDFKIVKQYWLIIINFSYPKIVNPPFCLPSTCPIRYLFDTLQQFPGGPLLLVQPIFSEPPWGLWLRDLSNSIVTLGSPNLNLGQFRYTWPIRHHFRPTQASQAHLGTLGPFRYTRPTQASQTHLGTLGPLRHHTLTQAPQAHLGTLSSLRYLRPTQAPPYAHLSILSPFRHTWPIRHHTRPT